VRAPASCVRACVRAWACAQDAWRLCFHFAGRKPPGWCAAPPLRVGGAASAAAAAASVWRTRSRCKPLCTPPLPATLTPCSAGVGTCTGRAGGGVFVCGRGFPPLECRLPHHPIPAPTSRATHRGCPAARTAGASGTLRSRSRILRGKSPWSGRRSSWSREEEGCHAVRGRALPAPREEGGRSSSQPPSQPACPTMGPKFCEV